MNQIAEIKAATQKKRGPKPDAKRNDAIIAAFKEGKTLAQVGIEFGVTRVRIQQIVLRGGVKTADGGQAVQMQQKKASKLAEIDGRCIKKWGMSRHEYLNHIAIYGSTTLSASPMHKFSEQRKNAAKRNIEWNLTFKEWFQVWMDSGKYELRGRGYGYVMARHGDVGPYSVENVYICTSSQNMIDSYVFRPSAERNKPNYQDRQLRALAANGYTHITTRKLKRPYQAVFRGKRIGMFETADEARSAYLQAFADYNKDRA